MLQQWGAIIQKHPWVVVAGVLLITIGFSIFLPSIQFRTDFTDFSPDDDLVRANNRVMRNFGLFKQIMLVVVEAEQAESAITPAALRAQYALQNSLMERPEINSTISFATFVDVVCQIEFGKSFDNCSDEQIQVALNDLLQTPSYDPIPLLVEDDGNEPIEYQQFPYISGKQINSLDIKNGFVTNTTDTYVFGIEVYDLGQYAQSLQPSIPGSNVVEWYIEFENLIKPDPRLDIQYQIAVRVEPTNPLWEVGKGLRTNVLDLIGKIRDRTLFNAYTTQAYLWIQPPDESIFFPIELQTANITFDTNSNLITLDVAKKELGLFGISTQLGPIQLPAKLSNFSMGSRYYEHPGILRKGGRITYNTSFLLNRLNRLRQRPILGSVVERMLKRSSGIGWDDFDQLFLLVEETQALPETFAAQDIQMLWTTVDQTEMTTSTERSYLVYPSFFTDVQLSSFAFLSRDYKESYTPSASLIILETEMTGNYEQNIKRNNLLVDIINEYDDDTSAVSYEVTGEGVISGEINEITSAANTIIGPSIFIIIFGILLINFRKISYVALAMLALSVATIWLFGTMVLLGIDFNVIAVALTPLILGLGVDYSVHLFHNYRSELEKGRSPGDAIRYSIQDIGTAMFLAMITTVIAFTSFLSSNIGPVRDFGILLAIGVIYTFITSITILAALRYILDRRKKSFVSRTQKIYSIRTIMSRFADIIVSHKKTILFGIVVLTIILSTGASQINTGFDLNEFLPQDTPTLQLYEKVADDFPSSSQAQEYIFIEGSVATVSLLEGLRITHERLKDDTYVSRNSDGSPNTVSVYTVIQQVVLNNQTLIQQFNIDPETAIPQTDADVLALFDYLTDDGGDETEDITIGGFSANDLNFEIDSVLYKTENGYEAALVRVYIDPALQTMEGNINDDLELLQNELQADVADYGDDVDVTITGNLLVTLKITNSLTDSQILSTGISIILAALVLIIAYRNPLLGLIAMIPVGFSIVWILGTMFYIGYSLNVLTITVTSITIGIGIDYAIHATERFRLVADKTGDPDLSVCETISHTGGALFIAALTTTMGFGILVFAPIPPQQQFGLIIAITIVFSFVTSVLILPLALSYWAKKRKLKRGYIISPSKGKNGHLKLSCDVKKK